MTTLDDFRAKLAQLPPEQRAGAIARGFATLVDATADLVQDAPHWPGDEADEVEAAHVLLLQGILNLYAAWLKHLPEPLKREDMH
ncbi:MAG: hypothetical protein OXU75_09250 [Deltaproteobacteria bacterium]|nr:hypothetical protein [Deltaproteobacteria bacterium]